MTRDESLEADSGSAEARLRRARNGQRESPLDSWLDQSGRRCKASFNGQTYNMHSRAHQIYRFKVFLSDTQWVRQRAARLYATMCNVGCLALQERIPSRPSGYGGWLTWSEAG